jgi:hypothetical protein
MRPHTLTEHEGNIMIIARTALFVVGGVLILAALLLGLIGASYHDRGALSREVSCGSPWFPAFDNAGDAAVCSAVTAPRAGLATGLLIVGGFALVGAVASRRTVAA